MWMFKIFRKLPNLPLIHAMTNYLELYKLIIQSDKGPNRSPIMGKRHIELWNLI